MFSTLLLLIFVAVVAGSLLVLKHRRYEKNNPLNVFNVSSIRKIISLIDENWGNNDYRIIF